MAVSTRSARATVREASTSPPRDPRGPPRIPMPDGGVEGVRPPPPPPPPVRLGLGGPTSPRPDPPSPHSSDGRSTRAHSPFARPWRQHPRKAPDMTADDQPSTSQHRREGRDRPRSPSIGEPYYSQVDLHHTLSAVLEHMGVPLPSTSGRTAPQRHQLGPELPSGDVRVHDELDRRPSPWRGPYERTSYPDRRYDHRPIPGGHSRDYRPDDDRCDYQGDRVPVVPAYGAQDHEYPDRRADPPRHRDYYHDGEYTTCARGDPHRRRDYDPRPDYPRYDHEVPPRAPLRPDYADPYDREYDRRRYPNPPCRHHDDRDFYDQRDDPDRRREDQRACMQKSVRVEVPVFDGSREPKDFIDWVSSMNSYFRWYRMDTDLCVEYAEMRLGRQAKIF